MEYVAECAALDSSLITWVTAIAVAVVSVLLVLLTTGTESTSRQMFMIFACSTCLTFGCSGTSGLMLYRLQQNPSAACGSAWDEEHHHWMYAWLFATAFSPFPPAALAALSLSTASFSGRTIGILIVFALALGVSAFEIFQFVTLNTVTAVYPLSFMGVALLVALVVPLTQDLQQVTLAAMLSAGLYLAGGLASFASLPGVMTEHAVCNVLVALSVVFAWFTTQGKPPELKDDRKLTQPYSDPERERMLQGQTDTEVEQPCCFCFKKRAPQETDWTYARNS
ncbi:unnamed protein product [Effrenium voratum]|uniref:Uncharacterized protein n=1 Tax=Effrenium voratum TaxID=2562239 RepID=A0AA36JFG3_9DINO|nr:unnamed protein product [Effrenium voratum]CAJ1405243.1 unnamed protein product [Effrenium voratum]CAJ1462256.1 unnamed protein product [Effrenium voratum]